MQGTILALAVIAFAGYERGGRGQERVGVAW